MQSTYLTISSYLEIQQPCFFPIGRNGPYGVLLSAAFMAAWRSAFNCWTMSLYMHGYLNSHTHIHTYTHIDNIHKEHTYPNDILCDMCYVFTSKSFWTYLREAPRNILVWLDCCVILWAPLSRWCGCKAASLVLIVPVATASLSLSGFASKPTAALKTIPPATWRRYGGTARTRSSGGN